MNMQDSGNPTYANIAQRPSSSPFEREICCRELSGAPGWLGEFSRNFPLPGPIGAIIAKKLLVGESRDGARKHATFKEANMIPHHPGQSEQGSRPLRFLRTDVV